jgi:hypothetical protein
LSGINGRLGQTVLELEKKMEETFKRYIKEINKAYQKGDSTEHTHRPALQ